MIGDLVTVELQVGGQAIPFTFPDSPGVKLIVREILANRTYPRIECIAGDVDRVIDAGANLGAASIFFALSYPRARIFAYEPSARAFELLEANARHHPRIEARRAGLHDHAGRAVLSLAGAGGEGNSLAHDPNIHEGQETVTLLRARDEWRHVAAGARCLILKVDTEGCEVPILRDLQPWPDSLAAVHVEYHSEADRVEIERMMVEGGMILYSGIAGHPHRGEMTYVRSRLIEERTGFHRYVIPRP